VGGEKSENAERVNGGEGKKRKVVCGHD